jgi:hypothetical protein
VTELDNLFLQLSSSERRKLVVAFLRTHPERHDQLGWIKKTLCGTVGCIAGWTCALAGDEFDWEGSDDDEAEFVFTAEGGHMDIDTRARELLGLDEVVGLDIFMELDRETALAALEAI